MAAGRHLSVSHAWHLLLAILLATGCSDGPGTDTDAGDTSTDGTDVTEEFLVTVEPPAPPALPMLTPCPDGWREVEDSETGVTTCDPWPETGREDCGPGEAHFPGEPGCTTVGDPCPTGIWPEGLPTDRDVFYVDASAPSGGDGSRDSPFNDLLISFRDSGRGSILALAKGTYEDCLLPPSGRTLWGACAEETIIDCRDPIDMGGAIFVWESSDVELHNLTITGERDGIWVTGPGASCTIDGVIVDGAVGGGLHVANTGEATVRNFVARDILPERADGFYGQGISMQSAGTASVTRAVVERATNKGIVCAETGTTLTLDNAAVVDTAEHPVRQDGGEGIWVETGALLEATRLSIEGSKAQGIKVNGGTANVSDCVVRGTTARRSDHTMGHGIAATHSTVNVSRCLSEHNTEAGIVYEYSAGTLEDIVVLDTLPQEEADTWGRGLVIQYESDATVHRALLHDNLDVGLFVFESTAALADITITSTRPQVFDGLNGHGLHIGDGGSVTGERILLSANTNAGLGMSGGTAAITDLVATGTLPLEIVQLQASGIGLERGADLELTRAHVHDNTEIGIVIDSSDATLQHILVTDTLARPSTGLWGRGLHVQRTSHVLVSNAVFTGNRELSIGAFGETLLEMQDVAVTDTLLRACVDTSCPGEGAGMGVGSYGGAYIVMTGFFVLDSATCGLQIARSQLPDGTPLPVHGSIELHDGEVAHNPIGVNVQDETFNVELLMDNVTYHHNDQNLDSTFLPVPGMGDVG